jgi:hypothetical protein
MTMWNLVQQLQIDSLRKRQSSGESRSDSLEARLRWRDAGLDDKLEHLLLVSEAMWELLSERAGVTEAELAAKILEIDARDGKVDGKHGVSEDAPLVHCASCQAVVPRGMLKCQFCGADVPGAKADPFGL